MLDHEGRSNLRNGPSQAKKKEEKEGGKSERNEKQHLPSFPPHEWQGIARQISSSLPPSSPSLPPSLPMPSERHTADAIQINFSGEFLEKLLGEVKEA